MPSQLLALIPLAVGINFALGYLVAALHLPVFLDTVGTVLVAAIAGPWAALLTGFLSQLVLVVFGQFTLMWFLPVQLAVALYAGFGARLGIFRTLRRTILAGVVLGALAATMSWPISYFVFGGVTGGGVTVIITLLRSLGLSLGESIYLGGLSSDLIDKTFTLVLVRTILWSLPQRMRVRFPLVSKTIGRA